MSAQFSGFFPSDPPHYGKVQKTYKDQEYQQRKYPPARSHERQLVRKTEGPGRAAPVKEKVRIVDSGAELPALNVAYPGIYRVKKRRYDHEYNASFSYLNADKAMLKLKEMSENQKRTRKKR